MPAFGNVTADHFFLFHLLHDLIKIQLYLFDCISLPFRLRQNSEGAGGRNL